MFLDSRQGTNLFCLRSRNGAVRQTNADVRSGAVTIHNIIDIEVAGYKGTSKGTLPAKVLSYLA